MSKREYLIEPVQLKRLKTQLEYRLRLKENIKGLKSHPNQKSGLLSRLKKLF